MNPSEFTLRLLLLFLPGVITRLMIERLTVPHDKGQLYFFLHAFISGVFAYSLYAMILSVWNPLVQGKPNFRVHFLETLLDPRRPIDFSEVAWGCVIAVFNGFVLSALINRKMLNRFAQKIGVTKKFGDYDVWGYLRNSNTDSLRLVRIRDHRNNLCYEGWVEAFSDAISDNEIFLRDVKVFRNDNGTPLYEVSGVYLSQDSKDIAHEFYALNVEDRNTNHLEKEKAMVRESSGGDSLFKTKVVPVQEGDAFKGGCNPSPPRTERPLSTPQGQGGPVPENKG